jgi:hypothetical protein
MASEWTTDYSLLNEGDIFEIKGENYRCEVNHVEYREGGGQGMGMYPPKWQITTNKGYFEYDPWASHCYKQYRIIAKNSTPKKRKMLKAVYLNSWEIGNRPCEP